MRFISLSGHLCDSLLIERVFFKRLYSIKFENASPCRAFYTGKSGSGDGNGFD
jgi:hypothetical protein